MQYFAVVVVVIIINISQSINQPINLYCEIQLSEHNWDNMQ